MPIQSRYSPLIPSAFQVIQFPTKCAHAYYLDHLHSIKQAPSTTLNDKFKLAWIKLRLNSPGAFAYLLNITLTPITIATDMIIGLGELSYRAYRGKSRDELIWVARCKWGASPIQQFNFMLPSILEPSRYLVSSPIYQLSVFGLACKFWTFKKTFLLYAGLINLVEWVDDYGISHFLSAALPPNLGKSTFDILVEGEDQDEAGTPFRSKEYLDKMWKKKVGFIPFSPQRAERIYASLKLGNKNLYRKGPYADFYNKVLKRVSPEELLSNKETTLSRQPLAKNVDKAHRYWLLHLHPDKVPLHLKDEAGQLFYCLNETKKLL